MLMRLFVVVNLVGIRWFARVNNAHHELEGADPGADDLRAADRPLPRLELRHAGGGFFVHGAAVKSILLDAPGGGIIFSLLGFEQAVQLGGEAKNPRRTCRGR